MVLIAIEGAVWPLSYLGLVEMCSLLCTTYWSLSLLSAVKSLLIAFSTTASLASFSLWNVVIVNFSLSITLIKIWSFLLCLSWIFAVRIASNLLSSLWGNMDKMFTVCAYRHCQNNICNKLFNIYYLTFKFDIYFIGFTVAW